MGDPVIKFRLHELMAWEQRSWQCPQESQGTQVLEALCHSTHLAVSGHVLEGTCVSMFLSRDKGSENIKA